MGEKPEEFASGRTFVEALAAEIADLKAAEPSTSASPLEWAAWYLRQANILDEVARADPTQAEQAQSAAKRARLHATAFMCTQDTEKGDEMG